MIVVVCRNSKKGKRFIALLVNGVYVSFDLLTIHRVTGLSFDYLRAMSVGDSYEL